MGRSPWHRGTWAALFFLFEFVVFANPGVAQDAAHTRPTNHENTLAVLIERARAADLHSDPIWLALLQVDRGLLGLGRKSSVSTQRFFLSPRGKRDPKAELSATLASFLDPDARVDGTEHPQCAFIARRRWLVERLRITASQMPRVACEHYQDWRTGLAATGLTLVYPEGFMNNPASMFGHTLLRIDIETDDRAEEILGYAVDFTGEPGQDRGPLFVFRGILGLYPGRFGVNPYYQQLRRYAEWENRDIWEYRLDIDEEELEFLLMHLWELRGIDHPYYFFTENCSYHLLRLLELVKPELRDRDALRTFVIPIDTVRGVLDVEGFVTDVRYRASPATKLEFDLDRSAQPVVEIARRVASGAVDPSSEEVAALASADRAAVLGIAYELLRYSFVQGSREQAVSQKLARRILIARSKISNSTVPERDLASVAPPTVRPDQGHDSATASLTGGVRDKESYVDFEFRPAFHGLMDRESGYPRYMQIRFFDTNLRYFPERGRVRLEELTLVEAVSLSPRSEMLRPFAWSLSAGLATRRVSRGGDFDDKAVARVDIGAGFAVQPRKLPHAYFLATATLDAGPGLRHDVSLGPGARSGVYLTWPHDRLKSHFFADVRGFVVGDRTLRLRTGTQQRLVLSRNTALVLEGTYNRVEHSGFLQAELSLQIHF